LAVRLEEVSTKALNAFVRNGLFDTNLVISKARRLPRKKLK